MYQDKPPSSHAATLEKLPKARSSLSDNAYSASAAFESNINKDAAEELETGGGHSHDQPGEFSWIYMMVFLFVGTSHLMFWNSILNILADIRLQYFPTQPTAADTLTAAQTSGLVIAAVANSIYGKVNMKIFVAAAVLQTIVHFLTPAVLYAESEAARAGLLHAVYFVAGFSNGGIQSCGFALSGALPHVYTGAVAAGNGISGVITFVLWMILKANDASAVMRNLWILMAIGGAIVAASIFVVLGLYRRPDVKAKIAQDNASIAASKSDPDAPSYMSLLGECWPMVLAVFATLFFTLAFFPNVGPIRWSSTGSKLDTVLGMFQVGDVIGRMLPNFAFFILSRKMTYTATVARFLFVIFFVLFWKKGDTKPWDNFGFQIVIMLLFAISNGWISCCAMVHAPQMTKHLAYRGKVASVALVGLILGLTAGSWISKLIVLGD